MPKLSDVQTVTISNVPLPLLEAIKQLAETEGRPVSNFLRQELERIVAEHQAREALGRAR
jgi:predicted DNA binding CopG/RHH family protein